MSSNSDKLPVNWIEKRDPATSRVYWVNVVTNATTWVRPEEPLPDDWHEVKTDDGRKYYFNVITRATTWKRPVATEEDAVELPLQPGWQEAYTKDGRRYYFHVRTKEVTWKRPVIDASKPLPPLPAEWKEVALEDGRHYYYNTRTKETTWDRPTEDDDTAEEKLPENWVERTDDRTGAKFYFNVVTHVKADERPRATDRVPIQSKRARDNIFTPSAPTGDWKMPPKQPKSAAARSAIVRALKKGFLFSALVESDLNDLVDTMTEVRVASGQKLITQGENGDVFYVVDSGSFDVILDDVGKVARRGPGDTFGEVALLYGCPRTASVQAIAPSVVWALDRMTFRYMITRTEGAKMAAITSALRAAKMLKSLTDAQISRVAEVVQVLDYKAGDTIFSKGEKGTFFFIVRSGQVRITDLAAMGRDVPDEFLGAGLSFGERALLLSEPRAGTAIATEDTSCLVIGRKDFNEHLGSLADVMSADLRRRVLNSVSTLSVMSRMERRTAFSLVHSRLFTSGQTILAQGATLSALYVVQDGTVDAMQGGRRSAVFSAGDHWGDSALQFDMVNDATYTARTTVTVLILERSALEAKLGPFADMLRRGPVVEDDTVDSDSESKAAATKSVVPAKSKGTPQEHFEMADLIEVGLLGSGSFGRVTLVKHRTTGRPFALKRLQKGQIVELHQQRNTLQEKEAMMQLDHPFILRLHGTFQDEDCLFMVLELCLGGELFAYLARQPRHCVSPSDAQFYCACVIAAIDHMHSKDICYRDMKPENMLIDDQGYVKLIDFGFAKVVKEKTFTLCGTPEYLAPELVMGSGHGKGVDYWAIGILTYEMIVGSSPFADHQHGDQMTICRNIVEKKLRMPKAVPSVAASLIRQLLNRTVALRLGCGKDGVSEIMNHKWFRRFDWVKQSQKRLKAPWVPKLKDPFDLSNFVPEDYAPRVAAYHGPQDWCEGW